jgi:osmotically-inducible protein OsmY
VPLARDLLLRSIETTEVVIMKSRIVPIAFAAVALAWPVRVHASDAENSKRNVVDRNEATVTPGDQGESKADIAITQQIRKEVVAHDGFSVDAKNVKIITRDGVVTLRGPVKTVGEKEMVASLAAQTDGVKRVDDQLEIAGSKK